MREAESQAAIRILAEFNASYMAEVKGGLANCCKPLQRFASRSLAGFRTQVRSRLDDRIGRRNAVAIA